MAINEFIARLKEQEPIGRQVVTIDDYSLQSDPKLDFILQDGDTLFIPKRSSSISVVGRGIKFEYSFV
jgi:ribosomal protein L16 Arg81 hydroxylase